MFQILDAMNQDSGIHLSQLQVDGGMTSNRLLMQLQADILCIPVGKMHIFIQRVSLKGLNIIDLLVRLYIRIYINTSKCADIESKLYLFTVKPSMPETTALGAAMAAGAAEGVSVWSLNPEDLTEVTSERFEPQINPEGKEI